MYSGRSLRLRCRIGARPHEIHGNPGRVFTVDNRPAASTLAGAGFGQVLVNCRVARTTDSFDESRRWSISVRCSSVSGRVYSVGGLVFGSFIARVHR